MASINSQRPPSSIATFLLGIVCLAVFAAIVVTWAKMKAPKVDAVEAERGAARYQKRLDLEKEWAGKLQTVAWINKEKGEVQVPIEDAIRVVAGELKEKKVAQTQVKIPPLPPPPVVDPKSTEPPPLPLPSAPQGADLIHFTVPNAPATAQPPAGPANVVPLPPPAPTTPPPANPPTPEPAAKPNVVATPPARPPLINWTESK